LIRSLKDYSAENELRSKDRLGPSVFAPSEAYEIVLQEGTPADILAYVDGALLVDLLEDLVLPRSVRSAWAPVISLAVET
jgi:hypothetical protein